MQLLHDSADFRRLWLAQTISLLGGQITFLALPLTAATYLQATPTQMGLLTALGALPALLVGLFAGEMVDRRARRPILITADLLRAALLAVIPLAWLAGALSMPLLYLVAFLGGACALFFEIAYQALMPALVERRRLVEGNSLLEVSRSASEVVGPALGGALLQLIKAPLALALDACSFLASAALIYRMRTRESRLHSPTREGSFWQSSLTGMREVWRAAPLRALAVSLAAFGLCNAMIEAVFILYLTRAIGLQPGILGVVFAIGSIGFIVGATLPTRLVQRIGVGPTLAWSLAVVGLSDLALPLAGRDVRHVAIAVGLGQFCFGLGLTVFRVAQISVRQSLVPDQMLGRVGGTLSVVGWGIAPLGALMGGVLGQILGLQMTLAIGALLEAATALWIWHSPLWAMRDIPVLPADAE